MRRVGLIAVAAAASLVATGCSAVPGPVRPGSLGAIRLVKIVLLDQPLALSTRPHDPALYVAEKTGRIVAIRGDRIDPRPVLDISKQVSLGGEQGLLGLTFSPDGRFLYVDYTDVRGDTRVVEFAFRNGGADLSTRRRVLLVHQPFSNHNGGEVAFGPDGMLYIGLGDGGSGGDPMDNAQSLDTLLGKILRIDPQPAGMDPYGIPPDNPFVGVKGARPEIWAYGLRNPWRFSFDRATGDLWIGDVGQSSWEEIDVQRAQGRGANFGWNRLEGSDAFAGGSPPLEAVAPVYEYSHDSGGCVVTGGYVYRGAEIRALRGEYVFADFCTGQITGLRLERGGVARVRSLRPSLDAISSFGENRAGELFVMSLSGGLYRIASSRV